MPLKLHDVLCRCCGVPKWKVLFSDEEIELAIFTRFVHRHSSIHLLELTSLWQDQKLPCDIKIKLNARLSQHRRSKSTEDQIRCRVRRKYQSYVLPMAIAYRKWWGWTLQSHQRRMQIVSFKKGSQVQFESQLAAYSFTPSYIRSACCKVTYKMREFRDI